MPSTSSTLAGLDRPAVTRGPPLLPSTIHRVPFSAAAARSGAMAAAGMSDAAAPASDSRMRSRRSNLIMTPSPRVEVATLTSFAGLGKPHRSWVLAPERGAAAPALQQRQGVLGQGCAAHGIEHQRGEAGGEPPPQQLAAEPEQQFEARHRPL